MQMRKEEELGIVFIGSLFVHAHLLFTDFFNFFFGIHFLLITKIILLDSILNN